MEKYSVIIGSVAVAFLLLAFFLNLFGFIKRDSKAYTFMNVAGGFLSSYASWLIDYIPFVILEAVWGLVALVALIRILIRKN